MGARLHFVESPSELEIEWPFLRGQLLLAPDLWDTYYGLEDIHRRLEEKSLQLWVLWLDEQRYVWALSEVWTRGDGKQILVLWWAQGARLLECLPVAVEALKRVMRDKGFGAITVRGRRGWERVLAQRGFKFLRVELTHEVET